MLNILFIKNVYYYNFKLSLFTTVLLFYIKYKNIKQQVGGGEVGVYHSTIFYFVSNQELKIMHYFTHFIRIDNICDVCKYLHSNTNSKQVNNG